MSMFNQKGETIMRMYQNEKQRKCFCIKNKGARGI